MYKWHLPAIKTPSVSHAQIIAQIIYVISAYYAQYTQTCSDSCCPPHPGDRKESMEENASVDWIALTLVCNNQTSCEFENPGRDVPSCAEPYQSNYALVYFSWLPGMCSLSSI